MKNTFGQYTINKEMSAFQLHYSRSIKDWLDILYFFALGLVKASILILCIYFAIIKEDGVRYFAILFGLVATYSAYRDFYSVFLRLFSPTEDIVFIDHLKEKINIRFPFNKLKTYKKSEFGLVVYQLNSDYFDLSDQVIKQRFWVDVILIQKDRKPLTFLTINPEDIIESNPKRIENNLKKIGKGIAKALANELGVECRFKKGA